jgi:LmbE family N-acetylglucosaminyl deacetylase
VTGATTVVAPHPDDEVLGCSAALFGASATVVHVTDGVPPWTASNGRDGLRSARQTESARAWASLSSRVDCVRLGFEDLGAWQLVEEVAGCLAGVIGSRATDRVYLPAYQRGHPDHDATYIAGALARQQLGCPSGIQWWVYALYGLDAERRLRFGWLPPEMYGPAEVRADRAGILETKGQALHQFTSQVWPGSVLDRWLQHPMPEQVAPLPTTWDSVPTLPCFYDEELGFARHGASAAEVEAAFTRALVTRAR